MSQLIVPARSKKFLERERQVQQHRRLEKLDRQFKTFLQTVRSQFDGYFKKQWISKLEERDINEMIHVFVIYLQTGQTYEIYISLDAKKRKNECHQISSRLNSITMGLFLESEIGYVLDFIHENFWFRKSGFDLEHQAFKCLEKYAKHPKNIFVTSVRKATAAEDMRRKDFIVSCRVAAHQFDVWFDLKSNKNMVLDNRAKKRSKPSIHSTQFEIAKKPWKFIEKVLHLTALMFKKKYLNHEVLPEQLHII